MPFVERLATKLEKHGEEFTVNGSTYRGVFRVLDTGTMRAYLDDVEVMGVTRPGLMLVTEGEADIDVNDTLARDGRTYTVLKVSRHRIGEVTVVRIAILA